MAFINASVANWNCDHVAEWLRGLDDAVLPHVHAFLAAGITGKQLLLMTHSDLENLSVTALGIQELILEAVTLLAQLHYDLESESLQSLCSALSICASQVINSLNGVRRHARDGKFPPSYVSSVCDVLVAAKAVIAWLDRSPFEGEKQYSTLKANILKHCLALSKSVSKGDSDESRFGIVESCRWVRDVCDDVVMNTRDSLVISPSSLELVTVRKKQGDELVRTLLVSLSALRASIRNGSVVAQHASGPGSTTG